MIVDDPDAPSGTFYSLVIWNIEPTDFIPAEIPNDRVLLKPFRGGSGNKQRWNNGYWTLSPKRKASQILLKVYGLDAMLNLQPGATKRDLESAMKQHILQQGEAMATYKR